MRISVWLGVCGLTVLIGACEGDPGEPIERLQRGIIDGTDDRRDIFELDPAGPIARNADGVPLLVFNGGLSAHDGVVDLPFATLAAARNVCSSERYASQPVVTVGQCSSYLVGPRLVATAGHCTNFSTPGTDVSFLSAGFGFRMIDAATARTTLPAGEVYRVVGVRGLCPAADCTVLELERPVTNHFILPFRRSGAAAVGESVYLLGYPLVLPLKFDGPGPLFRVADFSGDFNLIMQQLDVAGGNSGSAIVNNVTHLVEGTLSGRSDIGLSEFDMTPAGCNIEHRTVPSDNFFATGWGASSIAEFVPPRCSGDAGGWQACGTNGCGICAGQLDTTVFDRYLQNHPNCVIDTACSGALTACSEACPTPTQADSSGPPPLAACNSLVLPVAAATASSVQQNHFLASFAVDGDPTTRWSSNIGTPQWLQLDMGARVFVRSVQINWQTAFSTAFRIEASDNAVNWATVAISGATQAGLQEVNDIDVDARFLRIFSTGATAFGNISVIDLRVVGDANTACQYTAINCGAPVKLRAASASASSTQFSYTPASAAIDDVFSTRWSSNFTDNEWLAQDLGTTARVDAVRINWEHAFAKSYAIQTGTSLGGPWTTAATVSNGQFGPQIVDNLNVTTRFLRLLGIKRATQNGYSAWEVEVYGSRDLSCQNPLPSP
jgi:hypothetical protein